MSKKSRSPKQQGSTQKPNAKLRVGEHTELMKFLIAQLPQKNRNNIKSMLANKQVFVDGKVVKQFNYPLESGQEVEIRWNRIPAEKMYRGISIIHEDKDLIVIDKHAGILSVSRNDKDKITAFKLLTRHMKSRNKDNKVFVVHRLDRDTSGLMIFAKSKEVQSKLQSNLKDVISERTYLAVVEGIPEEPRGTITSYLHESKALIVYSSQNPEHGQKAITHYEVLKSANGFSMLKVNPGSGRKNQIRVHLQDIGHPVIGDKKYGSKINPIRRLGLHSWVLAFKHPRTHEQLRFKTAIPGKFSRLF